MSPCFGTILAEDKGGALFNSCVDTASGPLALSGSPFRVLCNWPTDVRIFFLLKLLLLLWVAVLAGLFGSLPSVCSEEVDIDDRVTFSIIFVFGLLRAV